MPDASTLLETFAALARGPLPFVHHHDGGRHGFHVVVGVCTHGDEVGPLPAAVRLVQRLILGEVDYGGPLSVVVMNPDAARAGQRFLDSDLNRIFVDEPPADREGRRARQLMPLLDRADFFLDLHQTATPTASAFWTLPYRDVDDVWVRALDAAPVWMTRPAGQSFSPGTCCADEYVRVGGTPALTLELSERGFDLDTDAAAEAVLGRLLLLAEAHGHGRRSIEEAARGHEVTYLVTAHREPFGSPLRALRPGLDNLQPVQAGQLLSPPDHPEVRCPLDGLLVFPKYPPRDAAGRALDPVPGELYRVAAPLDRHPRDLWGG